MRGILPDPGDVYDSIDPGSRPAPGIITRTSSAPRFRSARARRAVGGLRGTATSSRDPARPQVVGAEQARTSQIVGCTAANEVLQG